MTARETATALALVLTLNWAAPGAAQEAGGRPLSAIDWLSNSVAAVAPRTGATIAPDSGSRLAAEPPVATGAAPETIAVSPLGEVTPDALGLTAAARSGLPRDLWGATPAADLAQLIADDRSETLPALRSLLMLMLTAELDPPLDSSGQDTLYLARVDKLLDLGALDPALALLELPAQPDPEAFRRWFDVALLIGEENRACAKMRDTPGIAPTFPARIFCLARGGDWNAAALALATGEVLGEVDPAMSDLLHRFLDPDLAEEALDLPPPARPTPLVLRLMEAVGQPLVTTTLPLAFAQSDLRSNAGWKARLEAGERLARTGAIEPNRLLGLYTERAPAASGGVWDRTAAVQRLEAALEAGDADALAEALPEAWAQMAAVELEVPFADLYGARLARLGLKGQAGALAFRLGLLSPDYESIALARRPQDGVEAFLIGLARGDASGTVQPDRLGAAIRAAFLPDATLAERHALLVQSDRMGELLLLAMRDVTEGARGDLRHVTDGLVALRQAGLESTARRAALELMLLERRG